MTTKHGHAKANGPSREYTAWANMNNRCSSPTCPVFKYYGGRGISVCDAWKHSFEAFLSDMGHSPKGMTLERIDPHGNYQPDNCQWASRRHQQRNRRDSTYLTVNGVTRHINEWSEITGIKLKTIYSRITTLGYSAERAVTQNVRQHRVL